MKFEMSEAEVGRAREWMVAQRLKRRDPAEATGFRFGFAFYPTTLGNCVKVLDAATGEQVDVSDDT